MLNFEIENRLVGLEHPVFVIAEIGVNHNGDIRVAEKMIREAARNGADCVKFQTFKAGRIVTKTSPKAQYQLGTTNPKQSQEEMLKQLELHESDYGRILDICKETGVVFLSTPYNKEDVDFLESLGVSAYKIASGQAVEPYFLKYVATNGKPIILSTGMCTMAEVCNAVDVIRASGNDEIAVLQCTTNYPSSIEDSNLRTIRAIKKALQVIPGYSDHTQSLNCATAAVALGAKIIERHFTLDKAMEGPDHASSSTPDEFATMVNNIREVEKALGSGLKIPSVSELKNAEVMRRSIVAALDIEAGTVLSTENVTFKRPGNGLPPNQLDQLLGRVARCDIDKDTPLQFGMVD